MSLRISYYSDFKDPVSQILFYLGLIEVRRYRLKFLVVNFSVLFEQFIKTVQMVLVYVWVFLDGGFFPLKNSSKVIIQNFN